MSLEDKLREILFDIRQYDYDADGNKIPEATDKEYIAQIKQAFADEGYEKVHFDHDTIRAQGFMTGQEWYERFEKETVGRMFPYRTDNEQKLVHETASFFMKSAKRAADIDGSYKHIPNAEVESQEIMKEQI